MKRWWSNKLEVTPLYKSFGQLMTMDEFISNCESGMLIDYDGFGYYATKDLETNIIVQPLDLKRNKLFSQTYTHVVWYNK